MPITARLVDGVIAYLPVLAGSDRRTCFSDCRLYKYVVVISRVVAYASILLAVTKARSLVKITLKTPPVVADATVSPSVLLLLAVALT